MHGRMCCRKIASRDFAIAVGFRNYCSLWDFAIAVHFGISQLLFILGFHEITKISRAWASARS